MQRDRCLLGIIAGLVIGLLLPTTVLTHGDKRLGVSPPDYGYIEIEPNSLFSGGFTVFNQGDEDFLAYAEVRGAPGTVTIEWQHSDEDGTPWKDTPEILIPAGKHRYGRFTLFVGDINRGQFYNWSIACGYVETGPQIAVSMAGFRINMIWPNPPPKWYQDPLVELILLIILLAASVIMVVIWKIKQINKKRPLYVPEQQRNP